MRNLKYVTLEGGQYPKDVDSGAGLLSHYYTVVVMFFAVDCVCS